MLEHLWILVPKSEAYFCYFVLLAFCIILGSLFSPGSVKSLT